MAIFSRCSHNFIIWTCKFYCLFTFQIIRFLSSFYSRSEIENWLQAQFKNKTLKDDKLSTVYRQEGNKYYARKDRLKSLEFYTKSLCSATPNGKEYGLALANRSAVSFEMGEYEVSLYICLICLYFNILIQV